MADSWPLLILNGRRGGADDADDPVLLNPGGNMFFLDVSPVLFPIHLFVKLPVVPY